MGFGNELRKFGRSFEDTSRRSAKYTFAAGGAMIGGSTGAKIGYELGSTLDDRKPQPQKSGTDLAKLRREAQANGFNPLTVLRATGGQGFARDQIPMGRLSSDAFFNAFDAYQQRNPPAPELQTNYSLVEGKDSLQKMMDKNKKLNKQRNIGREVIPGPIEYDVFEDGDGTTKSTKITGILRPIVDQHGVMRNWPADPEEMSFVTGSLFWTAAELDHQFGKLLNWRKSFYKKNNKDGTPMSEIRNKVNSQKILKKYVHTPKLSADWDGYKYTKPLQ